MLQLSRPLSREIRSLHRFQNDNNSNTQECTNILDEEVQAYNLTGLLSADVSFLQIVLQISLWPLSNSRNLMCYTTDKAWLIFYSLTLSNKTRHECLSSLFFAFPSLLFLYHSLKIMIVYHFLTILALSHPLFLSCCYVHSCYSFVL